MIGYNPKDIWQPRGPISQGVAAGEGKLIHLTGQIAFDENREVVGKGDVGLQMTLCFDHIEKILEGFGGRLGDIVTLQVAGLVHPDLLIELIPTAVVPENRFRAPEMTPR